jgi:hypothetical protein
MKRALFILPVAGVMMTASLALAQTAAPAPSEPANQAMPSTPDSVPPKRGDCVDLSTAPSGSTDDMQAALGDKANEAQDSAAAAKAAPSADASSGGEKETASQSGSETQPVTGPDAGTAPGGSGSSGWTGGTGGSDIGTSQAEELDSSPQQDHPQVASGLDPISGETAVTGPQAPPPADDGAQTTPTAPEVDGAKPRAAADC